jgi:hypothetical protein
LAEECGKKFVFAHKSQPNEKDITPNSMSFNLADFCASRNDAIPFVFAYKFPSVWKFVCFDGYFCVFLFFVFGQRLPLLTI